MTKLASNNRERLHLDKFKRCSRCEDKQLPCSRPEFKLKGVVSSIYRMDEADELAIAGMVCVYIRRVSAPARHAYHPWMPMSVKGYGYEVPKIHAQAVINSWTAAWNRAHVPTADDDYAI